MVGIILSLCGIGKEFVAIFASVFVTAISSLLTVLALLLSIKSNNELIALQKTDLENKAKNAINLMRNSLCLEEIEINKSLLPKPATHKNPNIAEGKLNMRIGLIFSGKNINELSGAVLKRFALYFTHRLSNNKQLRFNLCGKFDEFRPVESKNENTFIYEIITNVTNEQYNDLIATLDNVQNCGMQVDMRLILKGNDGAICSWEKRNHNRPRFQLSKFEPKKQIYIFSRYF